ncbi:MAG TPA: class I SAM-dependent methyltransferase [Stellaceae bacterium]
MTQEDDGYAADIPYLRDFKPMLAPAWLDHVALVAGIEPPTRTSGFAWCDLGCGQGVTAAILAATHPSGIFHGIDAMPAHIDHARRLAEAAAIPNLQLHAVDFAAAVGLELPQFDYIVAHGVYTWIGPEAQCAVRRFIDRRLKPGGLVYLSYNAMPGWTRDLPFQGLLREFGRTFPGDNFRRLAAAAELARTLAGAGVASLAASFIVKELQERPEDYQPAYLVHEFMPAAWQPLYVTQVRRDMATIGLEPVGSATLSENLDWMVLDEAARQTLGAITDPDARELVRDYYLDQRFRCDVFARSNRRLGPGERAGRLHSSTFVLARPVPAIRYAMITSAGSLTYDSPAARAIVAELNAGRLARTEDLNTLLTLCAAGDIMPAEPGRTSVADLNRALCGRVDGPEEIRWLALPCGTAVEVDPGLLRALRDGQPADDGWRQFFVSHGL